jgi:hypothetical protein
MPARGDSYWRKSDSHPVGIGCWPACPGQVWPQSLPLSILAHGPEPYLARQAAPQAAEAGAIGGIVGDIVRGQ